MQGKHQHGPHKTKLTMAKAADMATVKPEYLPARQTSANKPGRINLRAVGEVLMARGIDPTERILALLDPGVDEAGVPIPSRLDADVQARIWNELLQYTQPKLKSVEVKATVAATAFKIDDAQAIAIAQEFLRSQAMEAADDAPIDV